MFYLTKVSQLGGKLVLFMSNHIHGNLHTYFDVYHDIYIYMNNVCLQVSKCLGAPRIKNSCFL